MWQQKIDENGNQLIEVQETSWEVLGIEDTNGDGVFETLLITTQGSVQPAEGSWLQFCGIPAYTNSSAEIHRICKELYSNSVYGEARGMTVTDVNNAFNYTPFGGIRIANGTDTLMTNNLTTKIKDLSIFSEIVAKGTYTPDGKNTAEALGDYYLNGYYYDVTSDELNITDGAGNIYENKVTALEYETIFGSSSSRYDYYLASTAVSIWGNDVCFGPDCVWGGTNGQVWAFSDYFYSGSGGEYKTYSEYYRPVVSLRSKLPDKV